MLEWNALIEIAGLKAAWAEARQNGVTPLESFPALRGSSDRQIQAPGACHLLGDSLNDTQAFRIKIDQDDLGPVEIFALVNERSHSTGGAGAAAADVCHFYTRHAYVSPFRLVNTTALVFMLPSPLF